MAMMITPQEANHELITKNSDVNFGDGLCMTEAKFEEQVNWGTATVHPKLDLEIVKKIAEAAKTHQALERGCRRKLGWDGR